MDKYITYFEGDKFAAHNGIEILECRPGEAKAKVETQANHLNGADVVHGGLLYTLADFAFAAAVNAYGKVTLSVATSMSYFEKLEEGTIFAQARVVSKTNKLIHAEVLILHENGQLLANFHGTAYITHQEIVF